MPDGEFSKHQELEDFKEKLKSGTSLEAIMDDLHSDSLREGVKSQVISEIVKCESKCWDRIINGFLPIERLIREASKISHRLTIVTTNYDRVVEISAERAGCQVDTGFDGSFFSSFQPSRSILKTQMTQRRSGRKNATMSSREHVELLKLHGSLDWYQFGDEIVASPFEIDLPRLVIPPTSEKYLAGYGKVFEHTRFHANQRISDAAAILVVGFSFSDAHLQEALIAKIRSGTPTLILTRSCNQVMRDLASAESNTVLVSSDQDKSSTIEGSISGMVESEVWQLGQLLDLAFGRPIG